MAAPSQNVPSDVAAAVLKPSDPVPEGSQPVKGIDFNDYAQRKITVEDLVGGMANMGFQATSVGEAVRIINNMVSYEIARGKMKQFSWKRILTRRLCGLCARCFD